MPTGFLVGTENSYEDYELRESTGGFSGGRACYSAGLSAACVSQRRLRTRRQPESRSPQAGHSYSEMKWAFVEPQQGVFNFGPADNEVLFAHQYGQLVRGHNLVWHSQLPSWLLRGSFTNEQLADLLKHHIFAEAGHFRGKIWQWDVVNEPFNEDGTLRPSIWFNALGPNYIADALVWTHLADPHAKLYLNDSNIEGLGPKSDAMYALVKNLLAAHVPIDGVGFEPRLAHWCGLRPRMRRSRRRFAPLGREVRSAQRGVRMVLPATPHSLARQASVYAQLMQDCIAVRNCVDFTVWEYTDKYSW